MHAFVGERGEKTALKAPRDATSRLPWTPGAPFQRLTPPSLPFSLPYTLHRHRQPFTCTDDEKWCKEDEKSSHRRWRKALKKRVPVVALSPRTPLSWPPLPFSTHHVALPELRVQPQPREEPVCRHCCEKEMRRTFALSLFSTGEAANTQPASMTSTSTGGCLASCPQRHPQHRPPTTGTRTRHLHTRVRTREGQ